MNFEIGSYPSVCFDELSDSMQRRVVSFVDLEPFQETVKLSEAQHL